MPGALFHLERNGEVYEKAYGRLSYDAGAAAVDAGTLFDAASLTKILATAPSVLLLAEAGKLDLEAPIARYFPECGGNGKDGMTVRHLLTHSSGLPAGLPALPAGRARPPPSRWPAPRPSPTRRAPRSAIRTSISSCSANWCGCVSGMPLDEFAQRHIFAPLKMADTGYLPLARFPASRIAPTHVSPLLDSDKALHPGLEHGEVLQGVVHDPTSRRMGGVAGSAGVFTTARDLARFARMLLAGGELDGVRILSRDSVRLLTTVQSPAGVAQRAAWAWTSIRRSRARAATLFPIGSYGHTGFTGCILWVDPHSRTFYVLLSNRVYPDDKSNILPLYNRLGTLAAQAALGFDFAALKRPVAAVKATSTDAAKDYEQIGRFIYGSQRLQFELAGVMDLLAKTDAERALAHDPDLAVRANAAAAMFDRLEVDHAVKAEFRALMLSVTGLEVSTEAIKHLRGADGLKKLDDARRPHCRRRTRRCRAFVSSPAAARARARRRERYCLRCARNQSNSPASPYAYTQASAWPASGSTVYLTSPPAAFSAATMLADSRSGTASSFLPWNAQVGTCLSCSMRIVLPPPQTGAMAAK